MSNFNDFQEFYKKFAPKLRSVIFRAGGADALDDILQESFLKIWKQRSQFKGESAASSWAYRICLNTTYDWLRQKKRLSGTVVMEMDEKPALSRDQDLQMDIERALQSLSWEHRQVIVLFYYEEQSIEEIADILEVPLGTIKSRLHTARTHLEKILLMKTKEEGVSGYERK